MERLTNKTFIKSLKEVTQVAGYYNFYVMEDNGVVCKDCAILHKKEIVSAMVLEYSAPDWNAIYEDSTMNWVSPPVCDHCGSYVDGQI